MKKILFILAGINILVFMAYYIFVSEKDPKIELPLPSAKEYVKEANQWLEEKREAQENYQVNKTESMEEKSRKHWSKVTATSKSSIEKIEFYGKVIDQYEKPVRGVLVEYAASSAYLAAGSGVGRAVTNSEGIFFTEGMMGSGFSIKKFSKQGYQVDIDSTYRFENYPRFEEAVLWKGFTEDSPFIFKAWKVDEYPEVKIFERGLFLFTPDGRISTFDLLEQGKQQFKKGLQKGDFTLSFNRNNDDWNVRLEFLQGGFIESNDIYLNQAPESGYQYLIEYAFPLGGLDTVEKKYYIKLRDGSFGKMTIEYRAYDYQKGKAAIFLSYVTNLEQGRNLAAKR